MKYKSIPVKALVRSILISSMLLFLHACRPEKNDKNLETISRTKESCLDCHGQMRGFSQYHNPAKIGCSACHGGNIEAKEKDLAHREMIKIPGNLSNAAKTCGTAQCHQGELSRINNSLMTTNSGIVSIDKYAFGEIPHTDTFFHIALLDINTAAGRHLKNLCYKCHLGYEKKQYGKTTPSSRGGGCLACHLDYEKNKNSNPQDIYHPAINLNISNDKCFGCHSRSARISTNYEGWYETLYNKDDIKNKPGFRILPDGRVFAKTTDDVHHRAGMSCIDCHQSREIMGNGKIYLHENEAVKIQCSDCHPKEKFSFTEIKNLDSVSVKNFALRQYKNKSGTFILTAMDSLPLVNTEIVDSITAFLTGKLNKKSYKLTPLPSKCKDDKVHDNLSCTMCHTAWAPTCTGCHTAFDPDRKLKGGHRGKWYEMSDDFDAKMPVMAMQTGKNKYMVSPAIPGMIMTLDKSRFPGKKYGKDKVFLRYFAPVSAHTTVKKAGTCRSCHLNPYALGYGSGKLEMIPVNGIAKWKFEPEYENSPYDHLPADAWIPFLKDIRKDKDYSAHTGFYPLNLKLQEKVLKAGLCLYCHEKKSFKKDMISGKYESMLKNRSSECPDF